MNKTPYVRIHSWKPFAVRIILGLGVCYGVYTETGPWTTLFAVLMLGAVEAQNWLLRGMVR